MVRREVEKYLINKPRLSTEIISLSIVLPMVMWCLPLTVNSLYNTVQWDYIVYGSAVSSTDNSPNLERTNYIQIWGSFGVILERTWENIQLYGSLMQWRTPRFHCSSNYVEFYQPKCALFGLHSHYPIQWCGAVIIILNKKPARLYNVR